MLRLHTGIALSVRCRSSRLAPSGLTCRSRPRTATTVTRASTDTKPASTAAGAPSTASTNPWAQPGYLGAVVSSMPVEQQRAVFIGILAAIGAGTVVSCSVLGPAISAYLPSFLQVTRGSWFPLGPIFMAAGVAHFTEEKGFCSMYPHQGTFLSDSSLPLSSLPLSPLLSLSSSLSGYSPNPPTHPPPAPNSLVTLHKGNPVTFSYTSDQPA